MTGANDAVRRFKTLDEAAAYKAGVNDALGGKALDRPIRHFATNAEADAYALGTSDERNGAARPAFEPATEAGAPLEKLLDAPPAEELVVDHRKHPNYAPPAHVPIAGAQADPWRDRSAGMRCKSCMWFVPKVPNSIKTHPLQWDLGRCRRHAPAMTGFPVVFVNDWCGDHRVDENRV
jgi:hypothetical protein